MNLAGRQASIYNVTMTLADTEYSQTLMAGASKILVQNRGGYDTKLAFVTGQSGTVYMTIKAGSVYYEDMLEGGQRTLYFQCPTAGQVLEILSWEK